VNRSKLALLAAALAAYSALAAFAQAGTDRDAVMAREEFRRGVQAYNRYAFNEAILGFEKALAYKPGETLILDWLGRAYYRSGLEDTALRQWTAALSGYDPTAPEALLLTNRIETVRNRRSLFPELDETERYVEAGRYPGVSGGQTVFRQPTSVLPESDGSVWAVAYGSNEVVRIDPNGIVRQRLRGPVNGFDRPYDLARAPDGRLYLSEYRGNRVSVLAADGTWLSYIGAAGRGDGQFIGPQHLSVDADGYLYVVDFGNKRVLKFDPKGVFLLSFGAKGGGFPGFVLPTGIAARAGEVYVADAGVRGLYRFDASGNYLGPVAMGAFDYPESLRWDGDDRLIVADTDRVVLVDPLFETVRELGAAGPAGGRLVGAAVDRNGNIVAANFAAGEVDVLSRMDDLAAGLFVQIERVDADKYPLVTVDFSVQDRRRRPIVGLDAANFTLTEGAAPAAEVKFLGAAFRNTAADIAILVERSMPAAALQGDIAQACLDLAGAGASIVSLVSAGEQPAKEKLGGRDQLATAARGAAAQYGPRWKFDLGLRLAATDLLAGEKKRAVFFVTTGTLGERAFDRYGLSELAAYLANNGIAFYAAVVGDGPAAPELSYLCAQTGGAVLRAYRPAGLKPAIGDLIALPNGGYSISYRSKLPTDFGRAYLPVEITAYLHSRSGRDATGYFPPLE
jgi:DNA-binding beta-propeller fold protein YncE